MKYYVVKDIITNTYHFYDDYGLEFRWIDDIMLAHYFGSIEEAEDFISKEDGYYTIITIYKVG
jgi:hypothetical protein